MLLIRRSCALIFGIILDFSAFATENKQEIIKVPTCLATQIEDSHTILAENKNFRIIELPMSSMNRLAKLADKVACGRFVNLELYFKERSLKAKNDLAAKLLESEPSQLNNFKGSYSIKYPKRVNSFLKKINNDNVFSTLTHLTSYYNRSALKETGVEAIHWVKAQFDSLSTNFGRDDVVSYYIKTGDNYIQPSLVTVIGKDLKTPAIVLGAHIDTLDGNMPGASDDGSGSAILMETARILLQTKLKFKRPIYIVWYAAEERGLVGSQYVVKDFIAKKIPVYAVLQLDMAAYRHNENDKTMWVLQDNTDKVLSDFVASLIKTYIKVPVGYFKCGYACSDHASWTAENIPAALPFETNFENLNPYIHSPNDKMSTINNEHMENFSKLALAFAIELAS